MKNGSPAKVRNGYFDFLRGIAIIFVVGIHVFPDGGLDADFSKHAAPFLREVFNCAVPLFLAISGYFIGRLNLKAKQDRVSFWKKQIPKVYIPCLLWSLPMFYRSVFVHGGSVINGLFQLLLCAFGVFYFVLVIILMYLILPRVKRICTKRGVVMLALVSLLSIFLVNSFFNQLSGLQFGMVPVLAWPTLWLGFFALGIYLANSSTREYGRILPFCCMLLGLVMAICEQRLWPDIESEYFGYKVSSFVYSYGVVLLLFSKRTEMSYLKSAGVVKSALNKVGLMSFGVYLIHFEVIWQLPEAHWLVQWLLVLLVAISFIVVARRLFPVLSKKYLGFY